MYTRCIQNVSHILTNFCIHFVYKIKRIMAAKFCKQIVYKGLLKCGIHFVYIVYISSDLQKVYIIRTMCTICIQNSYKMYTNNCIQNVSLYFNIF